MEFNFNKFCLVDSEIIDIIILFFEDILILCVDLVFDLFEVDCSEFVFEKKGRLIVIKEFCFSIGMLEIKYLGVLCFEK